MTLSRWSYQNILLDILECQKQPGQQDYRRLGGSPLASWPRHPHSRRNANHVAALTARQPRSAPLFARTTAPQSRPRSIQARSQRARRTDLADRRNNRHEHGRLLGRKGQPASPRSLAPGEQMLRRDIVPTRDFRYHYSGRIGFRDDSL